MARHEPRPDQLTEQAVGHAGWALMESGSDWDVYLRHVLYLGMIITQALQVLIRNHIVSAPIRPLYLTVMSVVLIES